MWTQNKNLLPHDGEVFLHESFFIGQESKDLYNELRETIAWQQDSMIIYGKSVLLPRLTAWYADEGRYYKYSGIVNTPLPWTNTLLDIKQYVEDQLDCRFNSALLNYYRHEKDGMGWHSDDEPELGNNPVIASLSFGDSRIFQFKHKKNEAEKISVCLPGGSLLLMQGATQTHWLHRISKSVRYRQPRINITFRTIQPGKP